MLTPTSGKRESPSNRVNAPKTPLHQIASRALTTNQPGPSGTSPLPVRRSGASSGMAGITAVAPQPGVRSVVTTISAHEPAQPDPGPPDAPAATANARRRLSARPARGDGRRRGAARRPLGGAGYGGRPSADRPGSFPLRSPAVRRPAVWP